MRATVILRSEPKANDVRISSASPKKETLTVASLPQDDGGKVIVILSLLFSSPPPVILSLPQAGVRGSLFGLVLEILTSTAFGSLLRMTEQEESQSRVAALE